MLTLTKYGTEKNNCQNSHAIRHGDDTLIRVVTRHGDTKQGDTKPDTRRTKDSSHYSENGHFGMGEQDHSYPVTKFVGFTFMLFCLSTKNKIKIMGPEGNPNMGNYVPNEIKGK